MVNAGFCGPSNGPLNFSSHCLLIPWRLYFASTVSSLPYFKSSTSFFNFQTISSFYTSILQCGCSNSHYHQLIYKLIINVPTPGVVPSPGRGGGVLPQKRLMGMCRWMGSHFHDCVDYNQVAFSIELLQWGRRFSDFWGKKVLHIFG